MKSIHKNIFREISKTKSRFISIFAIIGLSVGFFSGLKSACPSMINTADQYFVNQNFMDITLLSTVGFDDDDIKDISSLEDVVEVMPSYQADLLISNGSSDSVVRVYSLPSKTDTNKNPINKPVVVEGRLPKSKGECVIDSTILGESHYKIGDTITFKDKVENKDTTSYIDGLEYKIVGTVDTPLYLTFGRGSTTIGSGSIEFYLMILPEDFVYERYTSAYVRTKASQQGLSGFSNEYQSIIDDEIPIFKNLSNSCIERFNSTTLSNAKKELSDAKKEYEEKKKEAEDKITDGEKELYKAQKEFDSKIAQAEQKIIDSEKQLADAKEQLSKGQEEYNLGIETAYKQLIAAQAQYDEGKKQYEQAQLEYDTKIGQAQSQLNDAKDEYNNQYNQFYTVTKPQAESKLTVLKIGIDFLNDEIDKINQSIAELQKSDILTDEIKQRLKELQIKLDEYKSELAIYQKQYDDGRKQLDDGEKLLSEAKKQLDDAQNEFNTQKAEGARQLTAAKSALDSAESQLNNGRLQYETEMNKGMLELQNGKEQIENGEKELEKGKQELENQRKQGAEQLKTARETLIQGKYDAATQLADAEEKLNDAQKQIDGLADAKWYVNCRNDSSSYSGLVEDAQRVDSIATVFPLFFLIVAVLVCLTTMTRMVEERRTEIGTFKALGYSNTAISVKYILYGLAAGLVGCITGCVLGISTLPVVIVDTYGIMYILPSTKLTVDWSSVIIASVAGVACTCVVAMFACLKELKIQPATLMRPKSPKPGKRILLEYIKPLWKHMNFTSKVTARNLFRYKARSLMTIIGIAGCTALIIAGFGLKSSIMVIADKQFGDITKYDEIYAFEKSGTASEKQYIMSQFHNDDRFSATLLGYMGSTKVYYENKKNTGSLSLIVTQDEKIFNEMFSLRERISGKHLELNDSGVVITERTSDVLNVKIGDTIYFMIDEEYYPAKITGITENYASNYMYMTPACYKNIIGSEIKYNVVFTSLADDVTDSEEDIASDYMKNEEIITVSLLSEQISSINDMLDSLNFIVFIMILCAGLLAVIVLYNLTNINIAERIREIATIKVLGFYNLETANYIYRENIVLTVGGALVGMFLGNALTMFIIEAIQMDMAMFPKEVGFMCYVYGFILTFVFSMLVNLLMYFKMKKISMVESLKSIE